MHLGLVGFLFYPDGSVEIFCGRLSLYLIQGRLVVDLVRHRRRDERRLVCLKAG